MKVTTKGQVTIPIRIRDYLGILPHTEVEFEVHEGQVVLLKPAAGGDPGQGRFAGMRGIAKGKLSTEQWMKATRGD
jgi:AbrB family looped-hinge helix DNA binding protein